METPSNAQHRDGDGSDVGDGANAPPPVTGGDGYRPTTGASSTRQSQPSPAATSRGGGSSSQRDVPPSPCLRREPITARARPNPTLCLGRLLCLPLAYVQLFLHAARTVLTLALAAIRDAAAVTAMSPALRTTELYAISIVLLGVHFLHETVLGPTLRGANSDVLRELLVPQPAALGDVGHRAVPAWEAGAGTVGTEPGSSASAGGASATAQRPFQPQARVAVAGLVGVGVAATVTLTLSVHLWLHLLRHLASRGRVGSGPSPLAMAGVVAFLVTQSLFPALLVLNGACACWASDVPSLCVGSVTAMIWAVITVGLYRSAAVGTRV